MLRTSIIRKLLPWLLAPCVVGGVVAHHGPEETIELLTKRIEADGETPVLLYKRATEWKILSEYDKAAGDLEKATELSPTFVGAIELLAKVLLQKSDVDGAIATAKAGIAASESGRQRAALQMVLARALQADAEIEKALVACEVAFEEFPQGDIDWYLFRGALQRQLGHHEERIAGFKRGHECTQSIVLRNACIDATIDAGRGGDVLEVIDERVAACRLKSSWLLRRGRALLTIGKKEQAEIDLEAAIEELDQRIHPVHPSVTLIVDRGLARALLGNRAGAMEDLKIARKLGAPESMLCLANEALAAAPNVTAPATSVAGEHP